MVAALLYHPAGMDRLLAPVDTDGLWYPSET